MFIRIGKATQTAMDLLGLKQYPFTSKDLNICFRVSTMANHPDKGGDHNKMIEVISAYKAIKHLAVDVIESGIDPMEELEAKDMFDFYEDHECERCHGTGEIFSYSPDKEVCSKCRGTGKVVLKCKYCDNGKFTLQSGRIIDCRACKGTGKFMPKCNLCGGTGYLKDYGIYGLGGLFANFHFFIIFEKTKCTDCKGTGKIRVKINPFNPVIPKGAIL